jgi:membrane-bound lytic murein transglycosylase B
MSLLRLLSLSLLLVGNACGKVKVAEEKHPGMEALIAELASGDRARAEQYRELLNAASYQQSIIDAMNRPAEAKPWKDYRPIFITEQRIEAGLKYWRAHQKTLIEAESHFGVESEYVLAIIGVETMYGGNVGRYKVLDALTTLGLYYPPRQAYFRSELARYLDLDRTPGVQFDRKQAVGSYAGAMGLGQFMPTSWLKWSVDFNRDGQIDLWEQHEDVIGSVANYLRDHGWKEGEPVTASLTAAAKTTAPTAPGLDPVYSVAQINDWGFTAKHRFDPNQLASLLTLEGVNGPQYYLIFPNFRVITRYNRSPLYAMAVHELAEALAARIAQERPASSSAQP